MRNFPGATINPTKYAGTAQGTVWSKAFIKSLADVSPPETSSAKRHFVISMDHYVREAKRSSEPVVRVYIVNSHFREFVEEIFPKISRRIAIVTGDADNAAPEGALGSEDAARKFLDDDRIVTAFIQNLDMVHPKAVPLPIGLDFHKLHKNKWGNWHDHDDVISPDAQENELLELRAKAAPFDQRAERVFAHFTVRTQPKVRAAWFDYLNNSAFSEALEGTIDRSKLWADMSKHQFVASPPGNGMDCHRTWEALLLGCVPIVQRIPAMAPLYEDLPVWEIDCLSEITPEAVVRQSSQVAARLQTGDYDFDKLKVHWWRALLDTQIGA